MKQFFNSFIYFFKKFFLKYPIYKSIDEPIVVKYTNDADEEKQGVLFGYNYFNADDNFGNGSLIVNDLTQKDNYYVVQQKSLLKGKPLIINNFRIMFKEEDRDFYLTKRIVKKHIDANGKSYERGVVPVNCVDSYQSIKDIVDISNFRKSKIDGNTIFYFGIQKKSFMVVSIYLYEEIMVGYFERKKIFKQQDRKNRKNGLVINQIMPKFSFVSYIKGLLNIEKHYKL